MIVFLKRNQNNPWTKSTGVFDFDIISIYICFQWVKEMKRSVN